MVSSLANQLQANTSLNAGLIDQSSKSRRRKPRAKRRGDGGTESYLFSSQDASGHDLESIHALGINGLLSLRSISPETFGIFLEDGRSNDVGTRQRSNEDSTSFSLLFSAKSKDLDRTLVTANDANLLDLAIRAFLRRLGPFLLDPPAGKAIEWLVRRFRINEFNVDDLLSTFLPYHESPHFAKMLSILHLQDSVQWSFLQPFSLAGKSLPREVIVSNMIKDPDLARFIMQTVPDAIEHSAVHRPLLSFYLSIMLDFIAQIKELDHATVAHILPALMRHLDVTEIKLRKDCILSAYVMFAALSQKCSLSSKGLRAIVAAMIRAGKHVDSSQLLTATLSVLGAQEETIKLSKASVDEFLEILDVMEAISVSSNCAGMENVLSAILPVVVQSLDDEKRFTFLSSLLSESSTPRSVIECVSLSLMENATLDEKEHVNECIELLSIVYQRDSRIIQDLLRNKFALRAGGQRAVDQLLLKLSLPGKVSPGGYKSADVALGATDADYNIRAIAIRQIKSRLSESDLNDDEKMSLREILKARIWDNDQHILQALYDDPQLLLPAVSDLSFVIAFSEFIVKQDMPRSLLRLHFRFLCGDYCSANPSLTTPLLLHVIFPFLLFTKPRQKSAASVWDILNTSLVAEHELLKGTLEMLQGDQNDEKSAEQVVDLNSRLIDQIAYNLYLAKNNAIYLDWLYALLKSDDTHSRLLGWLIARSLVIRMRREPKLEIAKKILDIISHSNVNEMSEALADGKDATSESFEIDLMKGIVAKPNSRTTLRRLQFSVIAAIAALHSPERTMDWLLSEVLIKDDSPTAAFICLMRSIYTLANSTSTQSVLPFRVNEIIFKNLGSDSLLFLAGVWADHKQSNEIDPLTYMSLTHATAFIKAHRSDNPPDFQCVIPAVISTLLSSNRRVRRAAIDCISSISELSSAADSKGIYAYDQVYGRDSSSLQYLEWEDVRDYLHIVLNNQDHLISDGDYVSVLHHEQLSFDSSASKKVSRFKQRILCFMLSHAALCANTFICLKVLTVMKDVKDLLKLQILSPFVTKILDDEKTRLHGIEISEILLMVANSFDITTVKELNSTESQIWPMLLRYTRHVHLSEADTRCWSILTTQLREDIFNSLTESRKLEMCMFLLELGSTGGDPASHLKLLLLAVLRQSSLMVALLTELRPISTESESRHAKRMKIDSPTRKDANKEGYPTMIFLIELLASQSLPASLELTICLLETLNALVVASADGDADLSYLEQLVMTCIESTASKIDEPPNLAKTSIRLDILVELMRVAENPQTFHQALLLMATLARLAPESILHNVMPVFTFMGSNVFHRDDTYSFNVIKKTIENIVPIMAKFLREKYSTALELYIGSRDFLHVFTEASNHVPRHRRTNFFTHLVDVLGPSEFLSPVCMLLVSKVSNRITRQESDRNQSTLSLPLAILKHYSPKTQILAMIECLKECQRLISGIQEEHEANPIFLNSSSDEDFSASSTLFRRKQCHALLIFIGHGVQHLLKTRGESVEMADLITILLELSTINPANSNHDADMEVAAHWTLFRCLDVASTQEFSHIVLTILNTQNMKMQQGAIDLLSSRLQTVKPLFRQEMSPIIVDIIGKLSSILSSQEESQLVASTFKALQVIALTANASEETLLVDIVPIILQKIRIRSQLEASFTSLLAIINKVGPRIIPHFRNIVDSCIEIVKRDVQNIVMQDEVVKIYSALFKSIPSFWGSSELQSVITFYLNGYYGSSGSRINKLMRLIAKQVQGAVLLPTLCNMWISVKSTPTTEGSRRVGFFFEVVKRTLHHCTRADVLNEMRSLTDLFLTALSCREDLMSDDIRSIEEAIISAFVELVAKLNEASFRPLFRRLYDWAWTNDFNTSRKVTFLRLYTALLDLFKGLMVPYMNYLITSVIQLLQLYETDAIEDLDIWQALLEMLRKSFAYDEASFWQLERLGRVYNPLVKQIFVCSRLKIQEGKTLLPSCLSSMADLTDDTDFLKSLNLDILMQTRSDNVRARVLALTCASTLWHHHGQKLSGFASETAGFILECAEDENDDVVKEALKLKNSVEAGVGHIDGL